MALLQDTVALRSPRDLLDEKFVVSRTSEAYDALA
jgi:hypothetical protein